jgi:AraC family transcriptional regulator
LSDADPLQYGKRVDRVIDHIRAHLGDELTLARLAAVAAFSPFHFHRVFKAITGETLFELIQRLRLERAASALTAHPGRVFSRSRWTRGSPPPPRLPARSGLASA